MKFKYFPILFVAANTCANAATFTDTFIDSVITSHPSVLSAEAERRAADNDVTAAWRQILPELQVSTAKPSGDAVSKGAATQPKETFVLEQKLWAGGKSTAGIDASKAALEVARLKHEEAKINVAISAIDALQAYRATTARIGVIDATLARLNRFVQLMDRRVAVEVSPAIDALLVRSRLVQVQVDKTNAVAARRQSITRLEQLNLSGQPINWERLPVETLGIAPAAALPVNREDALIELDRVVDTYPGVRRYKAEAEVAQHRQRIASADQYPVVYARLERSYYNDLISGQPDVRNGVNVGYIGLRFTPGAGLASLSYANAAADRAVAAQAQADAARRDLVNQVRQEWEELQSANSRLMDYRLAVKNAEAVSDSYERQFIVGRLTWQQTLDAVRELGQVGVALADTEASLWGGAYKLRIRQGLFGVSEGNQQ